MGITNNFFYICEKKNLNWLLKDDTALDSNIFLESMGTLENLKQNIKKFIQNNNIDDYCLIRLSSQINKDSPAPPSNVKLITKNIKYFNFNNLSEQTEVKKLSFKEYYDSKKLLKDAGKSYPKYIKTHIVNKYCKIPANKFDNLNEKININFKPGDRITVFWESPDYINSIPIHFFIDGNESKFYFSWQSQKVNKWINASTKSI